MSGYRCPWCEFTAVVASIVTKDHEPVCPDRPVGERP